MPTQNQPLHNPSGATTSSQPEQLDRVVPSDILLPLAVELLAERRRIIEAQADWIKRLETALEITSAMLRPTNATVH